MEGHLSFSVCFCSRCSSTWIFSYFAADLYVSFRASTAYSVSIREFPGRGLLLDPRSDLVLSLLLEVVVEGLSAPPSVFSVFFQAAVLRLCLFWLQSFCSSLDFILRVFFLLEHCVVRFTRFRSYERVFFFRLIKKFLNF